eukprot:TRINITY_DN19676_c0_g2_i2.p1 TRINITY_DN19676_c0_g2~~TRINITY_DN19676_c0_g2_i2.p1  ORF type:complete len:327 (-),score=29.01 TRINITY_DN19676_c0_g2_i2:437-1417(-)
MDTVKLRLYGVDVDIAGLPCESDHPPTIVENLRRDATGRDVTFNALYYNPSNEEVLDPCGAGLRDLADGVVRSPHCSGASASLDEDPLRLLRASRFASRFGFELDDAFADLAAGVGGPSLVERLSSVPRGRLLYEARKALLLHNRPSCFLDSLGTDLHPLLFGRVSGARPSGEWRSGAWPAAVGRVRRLEAIILAGIERGLLASRSERWRSRKPGAAQAALLAPDWRKAGLGESDWVELLLAALLWRCDEVSIRGVGEDLQLTGPTVSNILRLQAQSRSTILAVHTAPPGVHILHAAVASQRDIGEFWDRWPCKKEGAPDRLAAWR